MAVSYNEEILIFTLYCILFFVIFRCFFIFKMVPLLLENCSKIGRKEERCSSARDLENVITIIWIRHHLRCGHDQRPVIFSSGRDFAAPDNPTADFASPGHTNFLL